MPAVMVATDHMQYVCCTTGQLLQSKESPGWGPGRFPGLKCDSVGCIILTVGRKQKQFTIGFTCVMITCSCAHTIDILCLLFISIYILFNECEGTTS